MAWAVLLFWLGGYFVFYRFVLGKILYAYKVRDFLSLKNSVRINPLRLFLGMTPFDEGFYALCPHRYWPSGMFDFFYLEAFLFGIEFSLLLWLVSKFFSAQLPEVEAVHFELRPLSRPEPHQPLNLVNFLYFERRRRHFQFDEVSFLLAGSVEKVIEQVFVPYRQGWLVQALESLILLVRDEAQQQLAEPELDDE